MFDDYHCKTNNAESQVQNQTEPQLLLYPSNLLRPQRLNERLQRPRTLEFPPSQTIRNRATGI